MHTSIFLKKGEPWTQDGHFCAAPKAVLALQGTLKLKWKLKRCLELGVLSATFPAVNPPSCWQVFWKMNVMTVLKSRWCTFHTENTIGAAWNGVGRQGVQAIYSQMEYNPVHVVVAKNKATGSICWGYESFFALKVTVFNPKYHIVTSWQIRKYNWKWIAGKSS